MALMQMHMCTRMLHWKSGNNHPSRVSHGIKQESRTPKGGAAAPTIPTMKPHMETIRGCEVHHHPIHSTLSPSPLLHTYCRSYESILSVCGADAIRQKGQGLEFGAGARLESDKTDRGGQPEGNLGESREQTDVAYDARRQFVFPTLGSEIPEYTSSMRGKGLSRYLVPGWVARVGLKHSVVFRTKRRRAKGG